MKLKWKLIIITSIWSELLLFAIYIPARKLEEIVAEPIYIAIILHVFLIPLFLGGLWIANRLHSRFAIHGFMVGLIANLLFFSFFTLFPQFIFHDPHSILKLIQVPTEASFVGFILFLSPAILKVSASTLGAYLGRKRKLIIQVPKV